MTQQPNEQQSETPRTDAFWWCPNCKEEVSSSRVTNSELHEDCGHPVEWLETMNLPSRIARLESELIAVTKENQSLRDEIKLLRNQPSPRNTPLDVTVKSGSIHSNRTEKYRP